MCSKCALFQEQLWNLVSLDSFTHPGGGEIATIKTQSSKSIVIVTRAHAHRVCWNVLTINGLILVPSFLNRLIETRANKNSQPATFQQGSDTAAVVIWQNSDHFLHLQAQKDSQKFYSKK